MSVVLTHIAIMLGLGWGIAVLVLPRFTLEAPPEVPDAWLTGMSLLYAAPYIAMCATALFVNVRAALWTGLVATALSVPADIARRSWLGLVFDAVLLAVISGALAARPP